MNHPNSLVLQVKKIDIDDDEWYAVPIILPRGFTGHPECKPVSDVAKALFMGCDEAQCEQAFGLTKISEVPPEKPFTIDLRLVNSEGYWQCYAPGEEGPDGTVQEGDLMIKSLIANGVEIRSRLVSLFQKGEDEQDFTAHFRSGQVRELPPVGRFSFNDAALWEFSTRINQETGELVFTFGYADDLGQRWNTPPLNLQDMEGLRQLLNRLDKEVLQAKMRQARIDGDPEALHGLTAERDAFFNTPPYTPPAPDPKAK